MIRKASLDADQCDLKDRATSRIYVIDDDGEMRKSLHYLLATSGIASWPFVNGADFFEALPSLQPAPILLDIRMLGMDGLEILAELQARNVHWPVIVMSGHGDITIAVRAMKLGAIEFLEKPFETEALEASIDIAQEKLCAKLAREAEHAEAKYRLSLLTPRERQVINSLSTGVANKQVAFQMGLSTRTVEMYRASALTKLRSKSIAEVAVLLREIV